MRIACSAVGLFATWLACSLAMAAERDIGSQLPQLGSAGDAVLSRSDEYQIGRMIMRGMRDADELLEDAEVDGYLQDLGSRLAAQANDPDTRYEYFAVRDGGINAFALPGGFIGLNSGLVLLANSEAELASVVAHETAHVSQRHIARAAQNQSRVTLASTAAMLAALLVGAAAGGSGDALGGAIALGQGVAMQQTLNFTRSEEAEADRVGVGLLAAAGFNPLAMPAFFEQMQRRDGVRDAGPLDLLRSHPVTSDRIAETRARAQQYGAVRGGESSQFQWMRERVRVLSVDSSVNMVHWYAKLREQRALSEPERYGEALAYIKQRQSAVAVDLLQSLLAQHPDRATLYGAVAQGLGDAGERAAAIEHYRRGLKLFPRNVPLSVGLAQIQMQAGQAKAAHQLLLDLFNNVPPTAAQIRLTALAASSAGDIGDAYYYMSEYHVSGGDLPLANQQLELALAAPNLSQVQRKRFKARQDQIREWLREQQKSRRRGSATEQEKSPVTLGTPTV